MGSLIVKAEGRTLGRGREAKLLPSPKGPWGFWVCAVGVLQIMIGMMGMEESVCVCGEGGVAVVIRELLKMGLGVILARSMGSGV